MDTLAYCRDQVLTQDRARGLALDAAPKGVRAGLFALYAFNLELAKVAPMVSEAALGDIRFQWWRDVIDELRAGKKPRQHPVVLALKDLSNSWDEAEGLIDAWNDLAQVSQPETWQALDDQLISVHIKLSKACLALSAEPAPEDQGLNAYALAWGYGSILAALARTGQVALLPKEAGDLKPDQAAVLAQKRGQAALKEMKIAWRKLSKTQRQILAPAQLCALRLNDPLNADARAAFVLLTKRFLPGL